MGLQTNEYFAFFLAPQIWAKSQTQFPTILIGGCLEKNRCSDFYAGYCTSDKIVSYYNKKTILLFFFYIADTEHY
jgi:hypothetical protein